MPILDVRCSCGYTGEVLVWDATKLPDCPQCGHELERVYSAPPMIKMKGEGGYPSRHKQIFNTTNRIHPKLS